MAKAKKVKTGQIVLAIAGLLGIVAILLMIAPGITASAKNLLTGKTESNSISGFKFAFGGKGESNYEYKFNVIGFLSFVFVIVGLVGVLLSFLLKGKIGGFLAIGGFLLAGIFFFCYRAALPMSIEAVKVGNQTVATGKELIENLEKLGITFSLGIGAIIAGILSILASAAAVVGTFVIKK